MGKRGDAVPGKRIASRPALEEQLEAGESVLVEQFRREFLGAMQPALEDSACASSAKQEVAYFGAVAEKIVQIGGRLERLEPEQMSLTDKATLLLAFGDKLYQAREYRAASQFFYERVLQLLNAKPAQVLDPATDGVVFTSSSMGQIYVRSAFGVALSSIQTERRADPFIRHVGTLERQLSALQVLQVGMETAVRLEKKHTGRFTWLILNGSLAIFSVAKPMVALGFPRQVVGFLKWCLVALESSVMLSTTKYVLWKLQLATAICDCYHAMGRKESTQQEMHLKAALVCGERALAIVQRLRKEEELDLPVPVDVQLVLDRAQSTAVALLMRAKAVASRDCPTKALIESTFTKPDDQVRAAMDAMERITCVEKHSQSSCLYLSPYSEENRGRVTELLSIVIDAVRPFLEQLSTGRDDGTTIETKTHDCAGDPRLRVIFPLSFHLTTVRYCYRLGESRTQELSLLLSSILARVADPSEQVPEKDAMAVCCLASVFDALDSMRQSLLPAEDDALAPITKSKQTSPTELATGKIIPSESSLITLVSALTKCVLGDCDDFCQVNRDFLIAVALILWREVASPLLESLESCDARQLPATHVRLLSKVLEAIHLVFTATGFDDLLLHGQVALNFGALLMTTKSPRLAAETARRVLERIDAFRDELALRQSFSKGMEDSVDDTTPSKRSHSAATFSFNLFSAVDRPSSLHVDDGSSSVKDDDVGVPRTGALFGRLHQDLCCTQVDLLLLLYRAELHDAVTTNSLSPLSLSAERSSKDDNVSSKCVSETESRLLALCRQNGYMKTLLSIQRLYSPFVTAEDRVKIADECFKSLRRMDTHERDLQRRVAKRVESSTRDGVELKSSAVPAAPVVIARSSSAVTIQLVGFSPSLPAQRKRPIRFYMVYAKLAGAGTAVSLNNNQLPGTATPIYPASGMTATISGLVPNESYVFAAAAFDDRGELIQGIGETSEPVITLNPLPLPLCFGYLAQACDELRLVEHAKNAAGYLYDLVVSTAYARRPIWRANPFFRQALKRETVLRLPVSILDKGTVAMEILSRDEAGDPNLDGTLITRDPDGGSLLGAHVSVLESARRISIGVEVASAVNNQAMVGRLCFIGYRVLLPLLHLASDCYGMAYPALMTLLQGLIAAEREPWGQETRSLSARFRFELFRIAMQRSNGATLSVTLPLLSPARTTEEAPRSPELVGLDESLSLHQLARSGDFSGITINETPPSASTSTPPGKSTQATSKSTGTPHQTPRAAEDEDASEVSKLPHIRAMLESAGYEAAKVFKLLEAYTRTDKRAVEVLCKISSASLESISLDEVEHLLSSATVSGDFSGDFRSLLAAVGAASILPEEPLQEVGDASPPISTPLSVRSQCSSQKVGLAGDVDGFVLDEEVSTSPDDMYLYHWCGELFLLKAVITSRRIIDLRSRLPSVDMDHGPMTEDNIYKLLRGDTIAEAPSSPIDSRGAEVSANSPVDGESSTVGSDISSTTPREESDHDRLASLVGQLLHQTAACSRLFHRGQCWQSLQAAAQHFWNTMLRAWVPPSAIASSEARLTQLEHCCDAFLDMIELHTMATGYESQFVGQSTSTAPTDDQASASTLVVASTMAKLRVHGVWLADFIRFTIQAFACARSWERIVRMGERYFKCCGMTREGSRFAEMNFPILLHAQMQILQRQEKELAVAQAERQAFVAAFQEQEAKRKKKKSRLVVEEVATPEELAFRARDSEMGESIRTLTQTRDHERAELQHLNLLHEGLQKARNKCHQALDTCHEQVRNYCRRVSLRAADDELSTLRRQVVSSFTRCVSSCRQKRQKQLACQALQDLGDFHLACRNSQEATKYWLEALDNAFSTLRVVNAWRQAIPSTFEDTRSINGDADAPKIAGEELWLALLSCSALGKLVLQTGSSDVHQATECALMAAAIFTRLFSCALPHPAKPFLYGSYSVVGQLWPGRNLLLDSESVSPFTVASALICIQETLLQYEGEHAVTVMPVVAGLEYIAARCLDDKALIANATRLRISALTYAGRFQEAFGFLPQMLAGTSVVGSRGKSEVPVFHENKALQDPDNVAAMAWLTSLNLPKLAADLKESCHFHEPLIRQIVVAVVRLAVALVILKAHSHSQLLVLHSSAQNMVKEALGILEGSGDEQSNEPAHELQDQAAQSSHSDVWDELERYQLRCDVLLHHGRLLFASGQWRAALELSARGIEEFTAADSLLTQKSPDQAAMSSMDHELKYSPCTQRATLVAKCRRLGIACHIARGDMHAAIVLADVAIREAQNAGEKLFCHELELQRTQAMMCLGKREEAEASLVQLCARMVEHHAADRSVLHVRVLRTLGAVVREKAIFTADPGLLHDVSQHLSTAKRELDRILQAEGWVGVGGFDDNAQGGRIGSTSSLSRDKFLNLFYPSLPDFVMVSADLAQALAECPPSDGASLKQVTGAERGDKVLSLVRDALLVLDEIPYPRHMSATKARLLLLQGAVLKKKALAMFAVTGHIDDDNEALRTVFAECVDALQLCIRVCITDGGHDRALIRRALVELIELYVTGCFQADKDEHVHAAFHFLRLAVRVYQQEATLFDSVELQLANEPLNTGSLAIDQQLPVFITEAICSVASATPLAVGATNREMPPPVAPTSAPDVSKKAPATAPIARSASSPFDPAHAINYFVRVLREQSVLPTGNTVLQDTAVRLHYFLAQAHPAYARLCCLPELPPMPPLAPEIQPGLVCAHWGQDTTPGISFMDESRSERSDVTLFFTLGTTKIDMSESVTSADNGEAAFSRMERFVTTPLLSKRTGLPAAAIHEVRAAISRLRNDMEDEQSLVVEKAAFPARLRSVLRCLQFILRKPNQARIRDEAGEGSAGDEVLDMFGNAILLPATLETVRALEVLLTISKAVSTAENTLCYFLRDLLD